MSTKQAEALAREYLDKELARLHVAVSPEEYKRALKKATASFDRLQQAASLATKRAESGSAAA